MSKNTSLLLILWNVLLTALIGWLLFRKPSTSTTINGPGTDEVPVVAPIADRDTAGLKDARIAFFFMDSISENYDLIKDSDSRLKSVGRNIQGNLDKEMGKAQAKYQELMQKDPTYLTETERKKDEAELMALQQRLQQLEMDSKENYARMQEEALQTISDRIKDHLEQYNKQAGFDYIFSVQEGGQIWVGNKGLDITPAVVQGLNAQYAAEKAANTK